MGSFGSYPSDFKIKLLNSLMRLLFGIVAVVLGLHDFRECIETMDSDTRQFMEVNWHDFRTACVMVPVLTSVDAVRYMAKEALAVFDFVILLYEFCSVNLCFCSALRIWTITDAFCVCGSCDRTWAA